LIKKLLLSLLIVVLLFSGLLVFSPGVLVNRSNVSRALSFFKVDSELLREINQAQWVLSAPALFSYKLSYLHPRLCHHSKEFEGCLKDVSLELAFQPFLIRDGVWAELRSLSAELENASLNLTQSENSSDSEDTAASFDPIDLFHSFQSMVQRVQLGEVHLKTSDLKIFTAEEKMFQVEVFEVSKAPERKQLEISLKAKGTSSERLDAVFGIPWVKDQSEFLEKLSFQSQTLAFPHFFELNYQTDKTNTLKASRFAFSYFNSANGLSAKGLLGLDWSQELRLFLENTILEIKEADFFAPKVLIDQCDFSLLKSASSKELVTSLWGSVLQGRCVLSSKIKKSQEMLWGNDLLIDSLSVQLLAKVSFSTQYDVKGRVSLKSRPFSEKLGEGELASDIDFSKTGNGELKLEDAKVVGRLKLHSFKNVAATLNQYFLAVPAPFHVLDGVVSSTLEGRFRWETMQLEATLNAQSQLKSEHQKLSATLATSVSGDFLEKSVVRIDADLLLLDSQVQLPEVNLKQAVLPVKDPRLVLGKAKNKKKRDLILRTHFRIRTRKPLLVNNPKPRFVMPVVFDLKGGSQEKVQGSIHLEPFESNLFNRKIGVQSFEVEMPSQKISGVLTTKALEYDVSLMISGKPDSIKLNFQSSPPLERRQIIALLLFNDPNIADESEKSAAAGHFDVAAAQGALSLASFYMFGNSRLQSFNYDPSTKAVSARLRLDNGSSVELIAGEEGVEGVGYIRRIGRNWRIKTLGKDGGERKAHSGQALIEWFKYFD